MALLQDASVTPTWTVGALNAAVTSAAFSPAAGTQVWLAITVPADQVVGAVTSSPAQTWTRFSKDVAAAGNNGDVELWYANIGAAPGSTTVTITQVAGTAGTTGMQVAVCPIAFSGVETTPGGASTGLVQTTSGPSYKVTLTTTRAGSLVYAAAYDGFSPTAPTAGTGQTVLTATPDANGDESSLALRTGNIAASGTAVTMNYTAPTNSQGEFRAFEVRAAATSTALSAGLSDTDTTTAVLRTATALTATLTDGDQLTASPTSATALTAVVSDRDSATAGLASATALSATLLDADATTAGLASAAALSAVLVESDTTTAVLGTPIALTATVRDNDTTTAAPASAMVLRAAVVDTDLITATPTPGTGLTATVVDSDTTTATLVTAPGLVATVLDGDSLTAGPVSAMTLAATVLDADLLGAGIGTPSALSATVADADTATAALQTIAGLTVAFLDVDTVAVTIVTAVTLTAALADGDSITVALVSAVSLTATLAEGDTTTAGLVSAVAAFTFVTDGDLLTAAFTTGDRRFALADTLRGVDDWTFAVGAWTALPDTALPGATGRRATWKLLGNSDVTFTLDAELPEASQIHQLISDLWVFWKDRPLFRGRIGSTSDTGDGSAYTTTFNAADYRELLRRRELYEGDSFYYSNQDQALLGWNVISQTQARPGGNLGIVPGVGQTTGVITSATYQAGKSIGEALDQLSLVDNGFDYDFGVVLDGNRRVTTGLTFDVYYPARGADRRVILDHPGAVASFTRGAVASDYANALRVTGDTALAAVRVEAPDIATRPEGRWDAQFGDTSIMQSSTLAARATAELATRQLARASWMVTLAPEVWQGPDHIWLGDPVTLVVQKGRLNVVETLRVQEFTVALDDSSVPTVSLTLGAPPPHAKWTLRHLHRRLQQLERR